MIKKIKICKAVCLPLVVASFAAATLSSCGGDNGSSSPAPQPGQTPTWTQLNETVTCDATNPVDCTGAFGFTVNSNGAFQVGPAPGGQTLTGNLTSAELALLNQDVAQLQTDNLTGSPTCFSGTGNVGTTSQVNLTLSSQQPLEVYNIDVPQGSGCFLGNETDAAQLYTDLNTVMVKYYVTPFPSTSQTHVQIGTWAGPHAAVVVAQNSATFDFECANGTTDQAMVLDSSGNFSVTGPYNVTSGPIVVGQPTQFTATYSGTVTGNTMALNVSYTDAGGNPVVQQFTLTFGATPSLQHICTDAGLAGM